MAYQEIYDAIADYERDLAYRIAKEQDSLDYNPYEEMEERK